MGIPFTSAPFLKICVSWNHLLGMLHNIAIVEENMHMVYENIHRIIECIVWKVIFRVTFKNHLVQPADIDFILLGETSIKGNPGFMSS